MGHYGSEMVDWREDYKGFIPTHNELPDVTRDNLRFNIARANKAEAELQEIKSILTRFKSILK